MKKFFYVFIILTFCFAPLLGCDQPSTEPDSTPTDTDATATIPINLDLNGGFCDVAVDSATDDEGKQDFTMSIDCNGRQWFHIDIDGARKHGGADGVNVDVFDYNFLNWGTRS